MDTWTTYRVPYIGSAAEVGASSSSAPADAVPQPELQKRGRDAAQQPGEKKKRHGKRSRSG